MTHRYTRAALTSAGLSLLFLVVYGGCLVITSYRTDVGHFYFEWEKYIPFVPLMVVPYLSIDLFFIAAPFLCTSDEERRRLASRIVLAILAAGACFLLFPLKFAFVRPHIDGMLGVVFDGFRRLDLPYNLAPSLHIALRAILAGLYARHTRGWVRIASHVWFVLIGLSTLLVWQHHLIDLVTGFILAMYVAFIFPENRSAPAGTRNASLGLYYAVGCAAPVALAWGFRPWGMLFLWPAIACAILCAGYLTRGAAIFHKNNGRLPLASRLVLGPVLLGQRLSLLYYQRHCRPWDAVTPQVWIGRLLDEQEAAAAVAGGVTAVLDLTGEFSEARPFLAVRYKNIAVLDLTAPSPDCLREMGDFIAAESATGIVYVHCKIGYSRSAAAVGAWLLSSGRAVSVEDAVATLSRVRPTIVVRPEVHAALGKFHAEKAGTGVRAE